MNFVTIDDIKDFSNLIIKYVTMDVAPEVDSVDFERFESAEDFRIANNLPKVKMSYIDMKPRAIRSNRRKPYRHNYKRAETNTTVMHNDDSTQAA